jgi:hypothetical protein
VGTESVDYCRAIEAYLCRKNDGHLIRVVGPSFTLVKKWEAAGVPLKIAYQGIDRYFERYYRKGPRRRPVRIDFCDADVRDVYEEWRRAVLVAEPAAQEEQGVSHRPDVSLRAHLSRALARLSSARAAGFIGPEFDHLIDAVSSAFDRANASTSGLRGEARKTVIDTLAELDHELVALARNALDERSLLEMDAEVREDLAHFHDTMPPDVYRRACAAALARLLRSRLQLPTLAFS